MKALGALVALAFIAFVVMVGVMMIRTLTPNVSVDVPDRPWNDNEQLVQCLDGSVQEECPPVAPQSDEPDLLTDNDLSGDVQVVVDPPDNSSTLGCRTIAEGLLEDHQTFGSTEASQIHVSYWVPASSDQRERDVILDGGRWQRDSGVGGYFWAFAGCTEAEVEEKARLHQLRRQEELGSKHAGWGDTQYFTLVS